MQVNKQNDYARDEREIVEEKVKKKKKRRRRRSASGASGAFLVGSLLEDGALKVFGRFRPLIANRIQRTSFLGSQGKKLKMNIIFAILVFLFGAASAVFLEPFAAQTISLAIQPPPFQTSVFQPTFHQDPVLEKRALAHRAVVINAENEARLPPELLNPFYKNPRIAEALAKESWFGPGEEQVLEREAEKIPRLEVIKLLKQAGLARRR